MTESFIPQPLTPRGKFLATATIATTLLLWAVGIYAYRSLPAQIPVHFNASGTPDSYGSSLTFLILPAVFSVAPLIILLLVLFRFKLITRFPYVISLPAFYMYLHDLPVERRGVWINNYFELVMALGGEITVYLLVLLIGTYDGMLHGHMPAWFLLFVVAFPIILLIPFFYALSRFSQKMKHESEKK